MKLKQLISLFLAMLIVLSAAGCASSSTTTSSPVSTTAATTTVKEEKIVLKFGHNYAIEHPAEQAGQHMAKLISEKTNGRITIQTYPSQQLGASRELMTGLINGTVEMAITSTFGTIEQKILMIEMPYLFKDWDHVKKFRASEQADEILRLLDAQKVHAMGFWSVGFRSIGNRKVEVKNPSDLKGLLIRSFENKMLTDTLTALGVNVTVLPFGEVYVALQNGAIDGEENPFTNTYTMKFNEVEKYKTETRHMMNFDILAVSQKLWDSLSDADKKIVEEVAVAGTEKYNELIVLAEETYKQKLIDEGMKITPIEDYTPWIEMVKPVYEKWEPIFGKELIEKIRALGW